MIAVNIRTSETRGALQTLLDDIIDGSRRTIASVGSDVVDHAVRYPHLFTSRTGELQRNMGWRATGDLAVRVSSTKSYSAPLYFGSKSHPIVAKRARALRWVTASGEVRFARSVQHPGNSARPFFQRAIEYGQGLLGMRLEQSVTEAINGAGT